MTNFEKYYEEIVEKKYRAVKNGKPISCKSIDCAECELYDEGTVCAYSLLEWLTEEYEELKLKQILTKQQKKLCEDLKSGYIARSENDCLRWYEKKPKKGEFGWLNSWSSRLLLGKCFPEFPFIKWEDKEPYSIEDMLTWEVEE